MTQKYSKAQKIFYKMQRVLLKETINVYMTNEWFSFILKEKE